MNIHVVRSPEVSKSLIKTIYDILEPFNKPVRFCFNSDDLTEEAEDLLDDEADSTKAEESISDELKAHKIVFSWNELFNRCSELREKMKVSEDDVVVLLTDHDNELNWFSAWDPSGNRNFFIQTSRWEKLVDAESCYPVIYELAIIPLYLSVAQTPDELVQLAHNDDRGCPFDFCDDKRQVQLRMRTGDICGECHRTMTEKEVNYAVTGQVFDILDLIRSRILFRNRLGITAEIPSLNISTTDQDLVFFINNGSIRVHLGLREFLVYMLFLNHLEGIRFKDMYDHYEELRNLYSNYVLSANLPQYENTLERITDTVTYNTLSEVIAIIKRKLKYYLGVNIVRLYAIDGLRETLHKISVDRSLVTINNRPFRHVPGGLV